MSGWGHSLSLVASCFLRAGWSLWLAQNHHYTISVGLGKSLEAQCLFFCHTEGVERCVSTTCQMLVSPSPQLTAPPAPHMSVFSSFLLTGQGLALSPEGRKAHVTLDPRRANVIFSVCHSPAHLDNRAAECLG